MTETETIANGAQTGIDQTEEPVPETKIEIKRDEATMNSTTQWILQLIPTHQKVKLL